MTGIDGIYAAFITGKNGKGFGLLMFKDGFVSGADPLGVIFDGTYEVDVSGGYNIELKVSIPKGVTTVNGLEIMDDGQVYSTNIKLEDGFLEKPFIRVESRLGAANVTLKKLRGL